MVRFPAIRRLTVTGSAFSSEFRTNSPVKSREEVCIDPGATENSSIGMSGSVLQRIDHGARG